jgi:hypothetical protein
VRNAVKERGRERGREESEKEEERGRTMITYGVSENDRASAAGNTLSASRPLNQFSSTERMREEVRVGRTYGVSVVG